MCGPFIQPQLLLPQGGGGLGSLEESVGKGLWPEWGHCPGEEQGLGEGGCRGGGVTPRVCAQPLPRSDLKHPPGLVCAQKLPENE